MDNKSNAQIDLVLDTIEIDNYGALHLPITSTQFHEAGFEMFDIVKITFQDRVLSNVAIVDSYMYIDAGCNGLSAHNFEPGTGIELLANSGMFVVINRIAHYIGKDVNGKNTYALENDIKVPLRLHIEVTEPKGYEMIYKMYARMFDAKTSNRDDYPSLTDEEFCNFRCCHGEHLKDNVLYRSSSPIDQKNNANRLYFTQKAYEMHKIETIINFSDTGRNLSSSQFDYSGYYASKRETTLFNACSADFACRDFLEALADSFRYLISNPLPIVYHCVEGKDRTGFACAILEAFAGENYDFIMSDYLKSYKNYYKLKDDDESLPIFKMKLLDALNNAFEIKVNAKTDLQLYAHIFIKEKLGLSEMEIAKLRKCLVE